MKTRLGLIVIDSGVCESEEKQLIEVGRTYDAIRHDVEKRFKYATDEDFRTGKLGFYARSREDHLRSIAVSEFNRQFDYTLAGEIMGAFDTADAETDGATLTFKFEQFTEKEWQENERQARELGY